MYTAGWDLGYNTCGNRNGYSPPARLLRNQFRFERNNFALNKIILLWQERGGEGSWQKVIAESHFNFHPQEIISPRSAHILIIQLLCTFLGKNLRNKFNENPWTNRFVDFLTVLFGHTLLTLKELMEMILQKSNFLISAFSEWHCKMASRNSFHPMVRVLTWAHCL